jgi:hypothetical protein
LSILFARQLILVRGALGEAAHRAAFLIGVLEAVEEHMVVGRVLADAPRPERCFLSKYGALVMDSMPPAMIRIGIARREALVAIMTVCMPNRTTLLTVVA